jgi:Lon protease-like protein
MPLPLHIFEQRYRALLADIALTPDGARFGVVALRSAPRCAVPRCARARRTSSRWAPFTEILELDKQDDGTSDLLAVGSRRFRIDALVPDGKAYLRAEVSFLAEQDGELDGALVAVAHELMEAYDAFLTRLAVDGDGRLVVDRARLAAARRNDAARVVGEADFDLHGVSCLSGGEPGGGTPPLLELVVLLVADHGRRHRQEVLGSGQRGLAFAQVEPVEAGIELAAPALD